MLRRLAGDKEIMHKKNILDLKYYCICYPTDFLFEYPSILLLSFRKLPKTLKILLNIHSSNCMKKHLSYNLLNRFCKSLWSFSVNRWLELQITSDLFSPLLFFSNSFLTKNMFLRGTNYFSLFVNVQDIHVLLFSYNKILP